MLALGLTGTKAGGKGEIANYLKSRGFLFYSLSDAVREEAVKRSLKNYTIKDLQDIGNDLRETYGSGVLAKRIAEKINKEKHANYVIDGIRNLGEVKELKKLENFYLITIDAPQKQRFKWLLARERKADPKTWSEFLKMDLRDIGEGEQNTGQQVADCMKITDFKIMNDSTIPDLHKKVDEILKRISKD